MAVAVPLLIGGLIAGAAGAGIGALLAPKSPKPSATPAIAPLPTRTAAASQAFAADGVFRKRQGTAATLVTGASGAEAPSPGAKALLGQ